MLFVVPLTYKLRITETKAASCSASSKLLTSAWPWAIIVLEGYTSLYPVITTYLWPTFTDTIYIPPYLQETLLAIVVIIPDWFTRAFLAIPDVLVCDWKCKGFLHSAVLAKGSLVLQKIVLTFCCDLAKVCVLHNFLKLVHIYKINIRYVQAEENVTSEGGNIP